MPMARGARLTSGETALATPPAAWRPSPTGARKLLRLSHHPPLDAGAAAAAGGAREQPASGVEPNARRAGSLERVEPGGVPAPVPQWQDAVGRPGEPEGGLGDRPVHGFDGAAEVPERGQVPEPQRH